MNDFSIEEQATRYKQTSEKLQHAKATVSQKRDEVASIERELAALNDDINRKVCAVITHCCYLCDSGVDHV